MFKKKPKVQNQNKKNLELEMIEAYKEATESLKLMILIMQLKNF